MEDKFYKCGCSFIDVSDYWSTTDCNFRFTKCKKHKKDFIACSWVTWAKKKAPAQYRKYKKELEKDRS